MSISVEQYRCAIGMYDARSVATCKFGKTDYSINVLRILRHLLTHKTDKTGQMTSSTCSIVSFFWGLFIWLYLICLTLGMLVDNSRITTLQLKINDFEIPIISWPHLLLNWSVILLLSQVPKASDKCHPILFYITNVHEIFKSCKVKKTKKTKTVNITSWTDACIKIYAKYVTIINLILIVLVTPSIINPGPIINRENSPTSLKVAYCNMQGIIMMSTIRGKQPIFQTNKLLDFQNYLHMYKPDIVVINESWLNEFIHTNEVISENYYKCYRQDRSQEDMAKYNKHDGGGVFILVKQGINIETKLVSINCDIPILSIEVKFRDSSKICLSTFYRYGYSSHDTFNSAESYYRALYRKYKAIYIIGDMNLSTVDNWEEPQSTSSLENSYIDLFNDLGLKCLINQPTHGSGNILDLLLTNQPARIRDIVIEPDMVCPSDHMSISFNIQKNVSRNKIRKRKIYKYKDANWNGLSNNLRLHRWDLLFEHLSIQDAWNIFKSKLDISMRKFIPMSNVLSKTSIRYTLYTNNTAR